MTRKMISKLFIIGTVIGCFMLNPYVRTLAEDQANFVTIDEKQYIDTSEGLFYYATSESDAVTFVRDQIEQQKTKKAPSIKVGFDVTGKDAGDGTAIWDRIVGLVYSESETDADYLSLLMPGYKLEISNIGEDIIYYSCVPEYYATADQEKQAANQLKSTVAKLSLKGRTDYDKTKILYRYVCQNVAYDWDYNNVSFSDYGALIKKKATCQGFALLFYRLGKEAGLDVGIVCGYTGKGEDEMDHAWNVVKIDGKYYYLDPTLDSKEQRYGYFLKGANAFKGDHTVKSANNYTVAFSNYPIMSADRKIFDASYDPSP